MFLLCAVQFEKVIGQKETKDQLTQMVQHNRLGHALLFLGKEGSGALSLAIAFAQYIVCTSAKETAQKLAPGLFGEESTHQQSANQSDSCGTCPACTKADKLIHPDIHFSYPVITRKPGDKPKS